MAIKQGRVPFHAELMSAEDMRHPVRLEEFVDDPRSERVTRASVRHSDKGKGTTRRRSCEGLREKKKKKMNENG